MHGWFAGLVPEAPAAVLDVGAGSGRDAAWLTARGLEVVAAEPSAAMREEGRRCHADPRITWVEDHLPALEAVHRLGVAFDLVLLSAVWQRLAPTERPRARMQYRPGSSGRRPLRQEPSSGCQGVKAWRRARTASGEDMGRALRLRGSTGAEPAGTAVYPCI